MLDVANKALHLTAIPRGAIAPLRRAGGSPGEDSPASLR